MSVGLPPYPTRNDSAQPWLESIPADWYEKRAKYFFREVDERTTSGDEELLSVSHVTGVTPRSQKNVTMFMAESYAGHKLCRPGDLVINTMWAWMAALGVARHAGIVSPAYAVYRPKDPDAFLPEFLDHLLRTQPYAAEYRCRSTGIRLSRLRLYPEKFLGIPIVCPPRSEQIQILAYLNAKDRQFRRLIRAKRRLIELLNEQKQAIIHRAVTRGLDPNVRLKPSGIDWLGDVPEGWEVRRVKDEFECLNTRRLPLNGVERGAMTSRQYDYYGASGVIDKVDDFLFDDELILLAEDGANLVLRNLPLVIIARGKFWVNNHAHILKPKHGELKYLASLLESINYRRWLTGAAQPKLTKDRLMAIRVPVPPLDEQNRIAVQVDLETASLREAIDHSRREIDLLREYRTRLIADVVTGKLDVRGVDLPPLDDDGALHDIDALDDDDADEPLEAGEDGDGGA